MYLHYYLILIISFLGLGNGYTPSAELNMSAFSTLTFCWNISYVECSPRTSTEVRSPRRSGNLYQTVHIEGTYIPLS
jgi:hypothetical protein